jgi:ABC-type transport system involved in multi-copper enzyme maturation permease subunit
MRPKPRLGINPIIVKELRSRMRGARAFAMLTGMLLLLGAVSYALYRIVLATASYSPSPLSPQIGQTLFTGLAFLELMMVCFVAPAVTAGAISGEREKLTYEMLLATPLRPASILWGKLVSGLSYVFLLIFAAIPMASLVFIFGGVTPRDMVKTLVILMSVAVTFGVIGIFMSTWLGRTARATVLSYLVVLALLIGPLFFYILVGVLQGGEPPRWILVPNPMSALFSALTPAATVDSASGIFWGLGMALGGNLSVLTGSGGGAGTLRPLYHYTLPLYGAISLALYLLAVRLIQPTRRWRVSRKETAAAVVLLLALGGVVALAFAFTADRYVTAGALPTPTPAVAPQRVMVEREVVVAAQVEPTQTPTRASAKPAQVISPPPTPSSTLSEDHQAAIYAAVVRQLYTVDHTFGPDPPNFPVVYLVRTTDDTVGDPNTPQAEPQIVPDPTQMEIVNGLDGLPAEFVWVNNADEVPREDQTDTVQGGGAIITLGNVHFQGEGKALVSAQLFFSMLGATGKTYILEQLDGEWQVTGDTGVQWMS